MPIRRSEAYDDPLRSQSKTQQEKVAVPHKIAEKTVSLEENRIEWSNLIFLPFHPVFQIFVLFSVFVKCMLGPIQSVYPIVYCNDVMDNHPVLIFVKYCYWYFCDSFYGIDTFLHIVHRQVTDKAMRREHLPKSAVLLICDLVSLIPFFRLVVTDPCPPARLWPNILAFNEFLVIYRVTNYFSLVTTHSYWNLMIGYTIVLCMCLNCITCFWLLLTEEGFCDRCTIAGNYYDWRAFVSYKFNETDTGFATYMYGFIFVFSFTETGFFDDETKPSAILEFVIVCVFLVASYILKHFIIMPKMFAETTLRLRSVCTKYPLVKKITEETLRRNPSSRAHKKVADFYNLLWRKRSAIIDMPKIFQHEIPRYLRLDIKQDLLWPLYYHSPTLRKTSYALRRWLSDCVFITYKLPGEKFFTGSHSASTLYYLKSGVVQLMSQDDGTTPILSVTSGTIFGDINFFVPHVNRKVAAQCLTYCEVYYIKRCQYLKALHKYPADRKVVLRAAKERIAHARKLFSCKEIIRGLDRNEDEGIAWIKRRWWEIHDVIENLIKNTSKSREQIKCDLPPEETVYHCAKYIGQLVLCAPLELRTKSMFTKFTFPWIINPYSKFGFIWHKIVTVTVMLVLCLHPPNLVNSNIPWWFVFFSYWSDTVYALDLGVSLFTAVKTEETVTNTFSAVMFERFKSITFLLDILSTIWIENLANLLGYPQYYYTFQFNRLIKAYILFFGTYLNWDIREEPLVDVCRKIVLIYFTFQVITSHIVFELTCYLSNLTMTYFFGKVICSKALKENCEDVHPIFGVTISWAFEWTFAEFVAQNLSDIYVGLIVSYISYLIFVYTKSLFVSYIYLKAREVTLYQRFVSNLKKYYEHYRIHSDLLKRLDRYLICHWKYYKGIDVLFSNTLEDEPLEVYWKSQGEVAQKVISESKAFAHADPALVRELACAAKYLILPKGTIIYMFGIQCKNVVWVVQGYIKSEYHDDKGEMLTSYYPPGTMLSVMASFLGKPSVRSYSAYTDCEILYIPLHEFFDIYKRHTIEYDFLQTCAEEFGASFDEVSKKYVLKHRDYQHKLRDRIYSTRMSTITTSNVITDVQGNRSLPYEGHFWGEPESKFMQNWLMFRTIIVYISIACASVLGGIGAVSRWIFTMISAFCDCIAWIDIIIKIFLAYYDDRGILITDKKKCVFNYMTKAFVLDLIGAIPLFEVMKATLSQEIDDDTCFLINTICKFAHLYILFACFEYMSDLPTVNITFIMIIKWELVNILIVLGASHYFMVKCVKFDFNARNMDLIHVSLRNTCWMPDIMTLPNNLTWDHLHLIFAESLSLAESGMMGLNFGRFVIDRDEHGIGICMFFLGFVFWFISCYALTLLVLNARGDTLFQHSVNQLKRFLQTERVENTVIEKVLSHYRYCWLRTKGINIEQLANERIGAVFRQDLNYYFYKKTFTLLDALIKGGEPMERQLASVSSQAFFLEGHDIFRESDLITYLCVVHRGKVVISKENKKLIVLTKGDIFGQLLGTKVRPVKVTATAEDKVDLLYIDIKAFQSIITDDVRTNIIRNPQHRHDFLAAKHIFIENPYDTVQYLLRGRKTIRFPWSLHPTEATHGTWYAYFLHITWFVAPFITCVVVNLFVVLPPDSKSFLRVYIVLIILDIVHLVNFISEFYTIELIVDKNKCTYQRMGFKKLKYWGIYLDIVTFLLPFGSLMTGDTRYQFARVFRLKYFIDFDIHFCRSFKSRATPVLLKIAIILLMLNFFTCGWINVACREPKFPIPIKNMRHMTETIDFSQWAHPDDRGGGCSRTTRDIPDLDDPDDLSPTFVVPKFWPNDYIIALTYILLIHTHTSLDTWQLGVWIYAPVMAIGSPPITRDLNIPAKLASAWASENTGVMVIPVSLNQVYYKVFVTFVLQLIDIYILAMAINAAYTRYRELYKYDYEVNNMLIYLRDNGLCKSLSDNLLTYTLQLWQRQKGDKLPDIAYEGPPCLRQDLFTALYIHHLEAPPTLRALPYYFKRQLAARLKRMVIFPGKCIVREGDTFNITYFIHEGEVEKWYNEASGDSKMMSVLYTNGYFGCLSGLFVNVAFQFSYYTRTVVDLVYLNLENWKDLLDSYPDIKAMLYETTKHMKKDKEKRGSKDRAHGQGIGAC